MDAKRILPDAAPPLLSFEDLRDYGIFHSRSALRRAMEDRNFPEPIRTSARTMRFVRHEVERWLEARR